MQNHLERMGDKGKLGGKSWEPMFYQFLLTSKFSDSVFSRARFLSGRDGLFSSPRQFDIWQW